MGLSKPLLPRSTSPCRQLRLVAGASRGPDVPLGEIPADVNVGGAARCVRDTGRLSTFEKKSDPSVPTLLENVSTPLSVPAIATPTNVPFTKYIDAPVAESLSSSSIDSVSSSGSFGSSCFDEPHLSSEVSSVTSVESGVLVDQVFPNTDFTGCTIELATLDTWQGAIITHVSGERMLYVEGKPATEVNIRENVLSLMDAADEEFECDGIVICLRKDNSEITPVLHSLMYAGGQVANSRVYDTSPDYILVSLEL